MSTKIYNGYKLPNWTFKELKDFYTPLVEEANIIRTELYSKQLAKDATLNIDRYNHNLSLIDLPKHFKDKETFKTYYLDIARDYAMEQIKEIHITHRRNPAYDYEFDICFIPIDNAVLALLYTEQKNLTEMWENCQHVSEYGYWNNEEQDESITDEEWEQRRIDWDIALGSSGVPAENGLSFDPFKNILFLRHTNELVLKHIPDKDKRAKNIAKELLWLEYYDNEQHKLLDENATFKLAWNFPEVLENEYKEKYEQLQLKIKKDLIDITEEYLLEDREFSNP